MVSPAYMEESASPLVSYASRHIDAANRLVTSFSYLCGRAARKFLRSGLERCDLEQVAAVGLIKASRRYDAGTRTPFEAYAWLVSASLLTQVQSTGAKAAVTMQVMEEAKHFVVLRELIQAFGVDVPRLRRCSTALPTLLS